MRSLSICLKNIFPKKHYSWLNEKGRKTITDRAYNLMANIMGTPGCRYHHCPTPLGNTQSLYGLKSDFTVVVFYDPGCGHCKEVLPKLDSFYEAKWKGLGLKIFAVAKETDTPKKEWMNFIHEHKLEEWSQCLLFKGD